MKITKEMGRACLRELESGKVSALGDEALKQIGWLTDGFFFGYAFAPSIDEDGYRSHADTALALCAAIAGVKPEDVL